MPQTQTTDFDAVHLEPVRDGRHLLVVIDLSLNSWTAVQFALDNVARADDVLTVFHVSRDTANTLPDSVKGNLEHHRKEVSLCRWQHWFRN
jgi:Universal stress protein family